MNAIASNQVYTRFIKRLLDIVVAATALVVLSPVLVVITVLGLLFHKPPALFSQVRPGQWDKAGNETLFTLYKFRSMTNARDPEGTLLPDKDRLTAFGRFLRKTSLDELPELWNILKGDMSFIGPRPQLVRDMVFMTDEQRLRHSVRPGLTGLAQVNGRNAIAWEDKLAYDLQYIGNMTWINDMKILLQTISTVIKAESIHEEGMATAEDFGDYLLRTGQITQDTYRLQMHKALAILKGRSTCSKK